MKNKKNKKQILFKINKRALYKLVLFKLRKTISLQFNKKINLPNKIIINLFKITIYILKITINNPKKIKKQLKNHKTLHFHQTTKNKFPRIIKENQLERPHRQFLSNKMPKNLAKKTTQLIFQAVSHL